MMGGVNPRVQQYRADPKKIDTAVPKIGPVSSGVPIPVEMSVPALAKVESAGEKTLIRVSLLPESLKIELADRSIALTVWLVIGFIALTIGIRVWISYWRNKRWPRPWSRLSIVKGEVTFAGIGKFEISPNTEDLQIAHRIWTELKTRKAALPFDPEHDVITEVYDSWYVLFGKTRDLIANIPATLIQKDHSTREIVRISLAVLNDGLRPHLTRWQARYRSWYATQKEELAVRSPQEVQKDFPGYEELIKDLITVNEGLIKYAEQLYHLTHL